MGNAIKCNRCNNYYNASIYPCCPYCEQTSSRQEKETACSSNIKNEIYRFFAGRGKGRSADSAPSADKQPLSSVSTENTTMLSDLSDIEEPFCTEEDVRESSKEDAFGGPFSSGPPTELEQSILESSKTIGKYIFDQNGESRAPVVGWLVGTKGSNYGVSFPLKSGKNRIGRSHEMDVKLLGDDSVSRTCVAILIYDPKAAEFSLLPGESDSLCYVGGKALYDRVILSSYDELEFGDSGYNTYVFVTFCGDQFRWKPMDQREER